jgi:hypothetical protein
MLQNNNRIITKMLNWRAGADVKNGRLLAHSFHLAICFSLFFGEVFALLFAFFLKGAKATQKIMF